MMLCLGRPIVYIQFTMRTAVGAACEVWLGRKKERVVEVIKCSVGCRHSRGLSSHILWLPRGQDSITQKSKIPSFQSGIIPYIPFPSSKW
jgi:hypothetical protein